MGAIGSNRRSVRVGAADGMEDTLYDSESVRRFCCAGADVDEIPDEMPEPLSKRD
jgi:hypothetical protein